MVSMFCSFDDASSISSGDISDAINGLSTEDNLIGGVSLGADRSNAGLGKLLPGHDTSSTNALSRSLPARSSGLLTPGSLAARSRQQAGPSQGGGEASINWHKYTIGEQAAVDGHDLDATTTGGPANNSGSRRTSTTAASALTDSGVGTAVEMADMMTSVVAERSDSTGKPMSTKQKKDSGTNTDHSVLMMARSQAAAAQQQQTAAGQSSFNNLGLRQQQRTTQMPTTSGGGAPMVAGTSASLSKMPRSYVGIRMGEMSSMKGERISNYRGSPLVSLQQQQQAGVDGLMMMERRASGPSDLSFSSDGSASFSTSTPRKIISKDSLQQGDAQQHYQQQLNGGMATSRTGGPSQSDKSSFSPYVNANVPASFAVSSAAVEGMAARPLSAMSSPTGTNSWTRSAAQFANAMRSALSETESMESLPTSQQQLQHQPTPSVHQQIQQARALSASGRSAMLAQRSSGGRLSQDGQLHEHGSMQMPGQPGALLTGSLGRGSSPFNTLNVPLGKLASSQDEDCEFN